MNRRFQLIAVAALTLSAAAYAEATQAVTGLVNGMTIRTSDSWANVEVRAMSFGPGFCATHITVGDKTVSYAAPPAVYGPWVIAASHGGRVSFEVSKSDQCDTGTQAQVRYWRE